MQLEMQEQQRSKQNRVMDEMRNDLAKFSEEQSAYLGDVKVINSALQRMTAQKTKIMQELTGKIRVLESEIGNYKTQSETLF